MSGLDESVREITDKLDSVGNTTAAMGKGFAIGSAALTALALFVSYAQAVGLEAINLLDYRVIIGIFIGGMLTFLFSAFTMESVSKAAYKMIEEVRRQFREKPGIMKGEEKPDYTSCVAISTTAALHEMLLPGVMAVVVPLIVGIVLGVESSVDYFPEHLLQVYLWQSSCPTLVEHGIMLRNTSKQDIMAEKEAKLTKQQLLVIQ